MKDLVKRGLMVFATMTVLDMVYAFWMLATAERSPALAGLHATIIILLSGVVTRAYVDDKRMLVPAAAGAFFGTWLAIVVAP